MNRLSFHHIGIACESIQKGIEFLKEHFLDAECGKPVFDQNQNATLCMARVKNSAGGGGVNIELVSGKKVEGLVKKRRFLYHSCYEVFDIEKKAEELLAAGYAEISPLKEAALFGGRRVCFLFGELGLIELLEEKKQEEL